MIADDLTGAHAAAAAFASDGLTSVVVADSATADQQAVVRGMADVVICSTQSRQLSPDRAADAVASAVARWWPSNILSKRIDSTLRGNVAVEVAALLGVARRRFGGPVVGVVCAAHPDAGRTTAAGRQYLHGVPLERTETARAEIEPLGTSRVCDVVAGHGSLAALEVHLQQVRSGCADRIADAVEAGVEVLVLDAETTTDIDLASRAVHEFRSRHADVCVVTIDPGPLTRQLAQTMVTPPRHEAGPLLAVLGSASDLSRRQLAVLREGSDVITVPAVCHSGIRPTSDVVADLRRATTDGRSPDVVVLTSVPEGAGVRAELAPDLPAALARMVRDYLVGSSGGGLLVRGVIATGGEVADAVRQHLGAFGVRPYREVQPLVAAGFLVGGPWSGLPFLTKGGLVGSDDLLVDSLDALRAAALLPVSYEPSATSTKETG